MKPLAAILFRDMRIAVRVGGGALMGVLFFVVVVTLVPFALGPDLALLKRVGPAILWLAALRREGLSVGFGAFLKIGAVVMPPALVLAIAAALLTP